MAHEANSEAVIRSSMPMYFPPGFSLMVALPCAQLTNTAYDQYAQWAAAEYPNMSDFDWKPDLKGYTYSAPLYYTYWLARTYQEPFGFVAIDQSGSYAYLVFRGTVSDKDELQDAKIEQTPYAFVPNYGNVHLGFYEIYQQLSPQIMAAIDTMKKKQFFKQFVFTGHSLGCGMSTLAVPDVITNSVITPTSIPMYHYNLASPRVGDLQFAAAMNNNAVPTFRIVNTEDIVPDGPLAVTPGSIFYKHVGTPVDFTAQYLSIDGNHSLVDAYTYALQHPDNPQGSAHGRLMGVDRLGPDHVPLDHVSPAAKAAAAVGAVRGIVHNVDENGQAM